VQSGISQGETGRSPAPASLQNGAVLCCVLCRLLQSINATCFLAPNIILLVEMCGWFDVDLIYFSFARW
jgi:hypothetical protein